MTPDLKAIRKQAEAVMEAVWTTVPCAMYKPVADCIADIPELLDLIAMLKRENASLNVALFHAENGLSHPDRAVRLLIEAARVATDSGTAKDAKDGERPCDRVPRSDAKG